nr:hypothetical protein [uncultured Dysosmobacter sp.]
MPTKLTNLEVSKVDFVDAGDNKRADVVLFKRQDGQGGQEPTTAQEPTAGRADGILKRFLTRIFKAAGTSDEELEEALETVEKEATTFDEKMAQRQKRKAADEIWDYCWMLQDSLCSIFWDDEAADKAQQMETSVDEFVTAVKAAIPKWVDGQPAKIAKSQSAIAPERLDFAKRTRDRLADMIAKAETPTNNPEQTPAPAAAPEPKTAPADGAEQKGEIPDMKIDKSKLTPEELATLDAIEKKAGVPDDPAAPPAQEPTATAKAAPAATATTPAPAPAAAPAAQEPAADEDIYKGLHPAVKAELERLRKQADAAEERELLAVAKKYEIIGKKPEELVPTLKSLKAAGGDAYEQMIAIMDASVEAVEKSGIFTEVGKRGNGGTSAGNDAWAQIEKHAETIQKAAPTMTWAEAVDKACEQHPDLVHQYEADR